MNALLMICVIQKLIFLSSHNFCIRAVDINALQMGSLLFGKWTPNTLIKLLHILYT